MTVGLQNMTFGLQVWGAKAGRLQVNPMASHPRTETAAPSARTSHTQRQQPGRSSSPPRSERTAKAPVQETHSINPVAATLARAFYNDPLLQWALPDPVRRARALPAGFRTPTRYTRSHGTVLATSDHEAVSLWIPPGHAPAPLTGMIRNGALAWPFHMGASGLKRLMRAIDTMDHAHHRNTNGPHWYLWLLSTDPAQQGHGHGTRLLETGLTHIDRQGLPCYLETFQPYTVPIYQRHGFEVVEEVDLPADGPHMWAMLRPGKNDTKEEIE